MLALCIRQALLILSYILSQFPVSNNVEVERKNTVFHLEMDLVLFLVDEIYKV
jgi:hypothetical protein